MIIYVNWHTREIIKEDQVNDYIERSYQREMDSEDLGHYIESRYSGEELLNFFSQADTSDIIHRITEQKSAETREAVMGAFKEDFTQIVL